MMSSPFKNNVVIITGASSGIGAELALQLADQGAMLALAARDAARLNAVAADCRTRGARAIIIPTDVTDPTQCENLIAQTVKEFGRIDTLICNAGVGMWTRFDAVQDLGIFERLMRVNYLGSVYCAFYAVPHLKSSRGRIVAVSSVAGKVGVPERSGYSATKAALNAFFETLRVELHETGITVTIAYPDFVATGARSRNLGGDGKPIGKALPYGKNTMTTQECARWIVRGAEKRLRDIHMSPRGRIADWAKLIAPGLVDQAAQRASKRGK